MFKLIECESVESLFVLMLFFSSFLLNKIINVLNVFVKDDSQSSSVASSDPIFLPRVTQIVVFIYCCQHNKFCNRRGR